MPQFTEFPLLQKGEYKAAVDSLIIQCRKLPVGGESQRDVRARLKVAGMWTRERGPALFRFLRLVDTDPIVPSPLVRAVATADGDDAARKVLADRLWEVNPIIFKCVLERMKERVHSPNELLKYIDSFAYPGARLTGPAVSSWIQFGQGLGLFKPVGVRLGLDSLGEKYVDKATALDLDEFFDEDKDEAPLLPPEAPAAVAPPSVAQTAPVVASTLALAEDEPDEPAAPPVRVVLAPAPAPAPRRPSPVRAASDLASPLGRARPVPVSRFATVGTFETAVLDDTRGRLAAWAAELPPSPRGPGAADFSIEAAHWNDDTNRCLFRLAAAAALVFRLPAGTAVAAWDQLEPDGVLDALFDGQAPAQSAHPLDAQALLWISLLARRFAEHPELADDLDRETTATGLFERLDAALGRGLLDIELLWILRELEALGIVKRPGLSHLTATPDREVRDTLFRLGFLATPYAPDGQALSAASAAVRRAAGEGADAEAHLRAFSEAAGCAYDCPNRRRCDYACRERGA